MKKVSGAETAARRALRRNGQATASQPPAKVQHTANTWRAPDALREAEHVLRSVMAEGEREMESLGRDFEGLARASNAILESAGAIVGCAESDRMASVLPAVQKLGSAAKGFIRTRLEATAGILDTVIAEEGLLQQLSHLTRGQKAIVRETEMLRVLTNIEVARLGGHPAGRDSGEVVWRSGRAAGAET
jgi:hypothetical protein